MRDHLSRLARRRVPLATVIAVAASLSISVGAAAAEVPTSEPSGSPATARALVVTPSQGEGPFYPLELPADRDADLTTVDGAEAPAHGEVLAVTGLLLWTDGTPIVGATVEIWQTDAGGVYLHPQDPAFAQRDAGFQGYGESVTDAAGAWAFRTILPEIYGGRPRHIHAKVRVEGEEVLTTQIYFSGGDIPIEGSVPLTGTELDALLVEVRAATGLDGERLLTAEHLLVLA